MTLGLDSTDAIAEEELEIWTSMSFPAVFSMANKQLRAAV